MVTLTTFLTSGGIAKLLVTVVSFVVPLFIVRQYWMLRCSLALESRMCGTIKDSCR